MDRAIEVDDIKTLPHDRAQQLGRIPYRLNEDTGNVEYYSRYLGAWTVSILSRLPFPTFGSVLLSYEDTWAEPLDRRNARLRQSGAHRRNY